MKGWACTSAKEMMKIEYRTNVGPGDGEAVRTIVESSGFFSKDETLVAVELVEERLAKGLRSGYHFVFAEENGKMLGYTCFGPIACTLFSYDLYWIAVDNRLRGRGVGWKLLEKSENAIAELGGRRVYVETSSRQIYEPTRLFYQSCGYREEAVLQEFYAPGDAKVIYVKELCCVTDPR